MKPSKLSLTIENGIIKKVRKSEITELIIENEKFIFPSSFVIPGLVDSHAHIVGLGENLNTPRLELAKSKNDLLEIVQNISPINGWITGRGWNEELWSENTFDKKDLDKINKQIPIFLIRVDGHAAWANSSALEIAGIDQNTPDPIGGSIKKDDRGIPNGILIDNAIEIIRNIIPKDNIELIKKYIIDACYECLRFGITEVHDMDVHLEHIQAYKELDDANLLPIRLVQYIRGFDGLYKELQPTPYKGNNLQIKGLKFYADGALGSRGALMIDKYNDADTNGLELINREELFERAMEGCKFGWDIAVHAIGDKANRNVLDVFEKLRKQKIANTLRIEHSQLVHPDDINRFNKLEVVASVQPIHCTSDKYMAIKRLGEDFKFAYPWNTLLKSRAILIAGSDFPIESHNPFFGIDSFVNRKSDGDENSWHIEECLNLEEALETYCITPHLVSRNNDSGILSEGKRADICIIDNDLADKRKIKQTKCIATVVKGKLTKHL